MKPFIPIFVVLRFFRFELLGEDNYSEYSWAGVAARQQVLQPPDGDKQTLYRRGSALMSHSRDQSSLSLN